jgi:hypothetical protein
MRISWFARSKNFSTSRSTTNSRPSCATYCRAALTPCGRFGRAGIRSWSWKRWDRRWDSAPAESMPALRFSVRLRVVRRGSHVRHAGDPDELPEVTCHELRSIVGDDPRFHFRISFVRAAAQSRFRPPSWTRSRL